MIYNKIKYYEDAIVIPDINLALAVKYPMGLSSKKYRDIIYGGNKFVAVSGKGGSYSSDDGGNWSGIGTAGKQIIYADSNGIGNSYYIIIQDNVVYASTDLTIWDNITPTNSGRTIFDKIVYISNSNFLLVGHTGNTINSWHFYNTTSYNKIGDFTINGIAYATVGSLVYIPSKRVCKISLFNSNLAYDYNVSTEQWSLGGEFPTSQHTEFAYNEANGIYIATNSSSYAVAVRKSWGSNWVNKTLSVDTSNYQSTPKIIAARGYFFVITQQYDGGATVAYSKDGDNWKYAPIQGAGMTDEWLVMAVGDNKAIIMSQQNAIAISDLI